MKVINLKDFDENEGVFINLENLDTDGFKYKNEIRINYEKLLLEHKELLDKNVKYFIYCLGGLRSKKAANILDFYGYDVTLVRKWLPLHLMGVFYCFLGIINL